MISLRSALALWLIVAVQIAIPAGYYLWRGEPDDERFAWRMFSATRFQRCEVELFETGPDRVERSRALPPLLHASWIAVLRRGRRAAIEKLLAQRCREPGVARAALTRVCRDVQGSALPPQRFERPCTAAGISSSSTGWP